MNDDDCRVKQAEDAAAKKLIVELTGKVIVANRAFPENSRIQELYAAVRPLIQDDIVEQMLYENAVTEMQEKEQQASKPANSYEQAFRTIKEATSVQRH